jgi:exodeoxyribonuclease VII small subunit
MNAVNPDVAELSYEQARDELVDVVGRLESGAANLEDSLALWERGEALADRCQRWLDAARDRLAAAKGDATVSLVETPADADTLVEADEETES